MINEDELYEALMGKTPNLLFTTNPTISVRKISKMLDLKEVGRYKMENEMEIVCCTDGKGYEYIFYIFPLMDIDAKIRIFPEKYRRRIKGRIFGLTMEIYSKDAQYFFTEPLIYVFAKFLGKDEKLTESAPELEMEGERLSYIT
jgi:hypothetical protein